jgi:two-component system, cell cycle response regulator
MKKSLVFALLGFELGLGAPLGAFLLLWGSLNFVPSLSDFFSTQWSQHHFFYEYMLLGTCVIFSFFGNILGRYADKINLENRSLLIEAQTDSLTSLGNHRYLHEAFRHQYQTRKTDLEPISCLMMDLDLFKKVNDTYGHPFRDEILKAFAGLIKKTVRPNDIAARYGGEEFICILPSCEKEEAAAVAERLRAGMENTVTYFNKTPVKITVSVGVATDYGVMTDHQDLIKSADKALYQAKGSGRNKVVSA